MRSALVSFLFLLTTPLYAEEAIVFKKELFSPHYWFPYGLVLIVLLIVVFILAKNSKKLISPHSPGIVVEKTSINHKTKVYIINYQGQKFLLADNQNSLAIQALQENLPS